MPIKSIPSIAITQACEGADCQGCEDCPGLDWPTADALALERETWRIERMPDSGVRTAAFLELGLCPTEHPDAKAERLERASTQQAQLSKHKSIPSEAKALLYQIPNSRALDVDRIDYVPGKPPISTRCPDAGWHYGERHCVAGVAYRTPQPCQKDTCKPCTIYHIWRKLEQYQHEVAGKSHQSQLTISGLLNDNDAAAVRNYIAKRFGAEGPKRFSQINCNETTGHWEVVITFADVLRVEDFASEAKLGRLHICLEKKFPDCQAVAISRPVPSKPDLESKFYTSKKTPNGHIASTFSQGWIQPYKAPDSYQYGEIELGEVAEGMPAVFVDKHRCDTCEGIDKRYQDAPEHRAAAFADALVDGMVFDREAMADLADALHSEEVDAGVFALLRALPKDFPYDKRRLIMDTAQHVCRDADGTITLLPSARLAHVQVWRRAW